jgi:hypothetical protein
MAWFEPPPPHPATWGATPPLPDQITLAADEMQRGAHKTALSLLACDPHDTLAASGDFWSETAGWITAERPLPCSLASGCASIRKCGHRTDHKDSCRRGRGVEA